MVKQISNWLYRVSSWWLALAALAVFLLFSLLVLPRQAASAETSSGDAGTPDLSFYYSSSDLYRMAEAYGEQGRQDYLRARWTFDLLWPLVYTQFLSIALSWLYNGVFPAGSRWRILNLVPVAAMLLDYLENASTSLVMLRFPQEIPFVAWLAPFFTSLKWIFVGGSFVLLILGVVLFAMRWLEKRHN